MKKKRAKPRRKAVQERAQVTVDAILDAATQVLVTQGYVHATTNHIAARAGVSIGTLYQYFPDKDTIFEAIMDREIARLLAFVQQEALDAPATLPDKLRWLFARSIARQPYGNQLVRVLDQVPNAMLRKRLDQFSRLLVEMAAAMLRAHEAELTVNDVDLAAWVVIHSSISLAYDAPPALFREKLADEMTTLFTRYLTGR